MYRLPKKIAGSSTDKIILMMATHLLHSSRPPVSGGLKKWLDSDERNQQLFKDLIARKGMQKGLQWHKAISSSQSIKKTEHRLFLKADRARKEKKKGNRIDKDERLRKKNVNFNIPPLLSLAVKNKKPQHPVSMPAFYFLFHLPGSRRINSYPRFRVA